jgi:hypothetical protein
MKPKETKMKQNETKWNKMKQKGPKVCVSSWWLTAYVKCMFLLAAAQAA